mmetsp:Transcript_13855/g.9996  ORF Transcript_13855/g.9996 Transcript_13855/m.9996 type:complete len:165 (+) Transcript_13855:339-833(+)
MCIVCGRAKHANNKRLKYWTALLMEMAYATQVFVVVIYWPLLHREAAKKIDASEVHLWYHMLTIHSLPFLCCLVNVTLSKVVFIPSHGFYFAIEGCLYSVANFLGTMYRGHPLYPFIPWKDFLSVFICMAINVLCAIIYQSICIFLAATKKNNYIALEDKHKHE